MSSPFSSSVYSPGSTSSRAAWSPTSSLYTSTPNREYASQITNQYGPLRFPNSPCSDGGGRNCAGCYSVDCVCNWNAYSGIAVPAYDQDIRTADGICGNARYESSTLTGTDAHTIRSNDDSFTSQYSSMSQPEYVSQTLNSSFNSNPSYRTTSTEPAATFGPEDLGHHAVDGDGYLGYQNHGPDIYNEEIGQPSTSLQQLAEDERIKCDLGCRNRFYKNMQSFEAHLRNVHCEKRYRCQVPNCRWTKAFNNKTDLRRHTRTVHSSEKPYRCLRPDCPARTKAWARNDKLKPHNAKYH